MHIQNTGQVVLDHGAVRFIDAMGDDKTIVNAARVSVEGGRRHIEKTADDDAKLIKYLADHEHYSPFEHCVATLYIKCPLFTRSQWHRHRTFAYNEVSGRYSKTVFTEYYLPSVERLMTVGSPDSRQGGEAVDEERKAQLAHFAIKQQCVKATMEYERLLEDGVAAELARIVLPQNMYTEFYATANLRNWAHFLKLRMDAHAQWEMRQYANACHAILIDRWPTALAALLPS